MKNLVTLTLVLFLFLATSCQKESLTDSNSSTEVAFVNPENETSPIAPLLKDSHFQADEEAEFEENMDINESLTNSNNSPTSLTILQYLKNSNDFSLFYRAISRTGIKSELKPLGDFTIFAPDDVAIKFYLSQNNWSSVDDVPLGVLTQMVQAHFSDSAKLIKFSENGITIPLVFSSKSIILNLETADAPLLILGNSKAYITEQDLMQSNGTVQRLSGVLVF